MDNTTIKKDYQPLERRIEERVDNPQSPKVLDRKQVFTRILEIAQTCPPQAFKIMRQYSDEVLKELGIGFIGQLQIDQIESEFDSQTIRKFKIDNFYNRVIIPYSKDYFSGRTLNKNIKQKNIFPSNKVKMFYFIPSKTEIPEGLIIVEGETDAIACKHLFTNYDILSLGGVHTDITHKLHNFLRTDNVIIGFNKDEAGFEGTNKLKFKLKEIRIEARHMTWKDDCKDIDDMWRKYKTSATNHINIISSEPKDILIEEDFIPITRDEVKKVIDENFKNLWGVYEVCISTLCILKLKDFSDPVGVNIVGSPSGEKTTVLSFFYNCDGLVIKSDNFTSKCFVSHSSASTKEELEEIDLLPKIKDKCMIVPELAPIFGKRKEDLVDSLGTITRVFDGEGYESHSGSHGARGYKGDYKFVWLGATTPPSKTVWNVMGNMGTRWFFCEINEEEKSNSEKRDIIVNNNTYLHRIKKCREVTERYIKTIFMDGHKRNMEWDNNKNDINAAGIIVDCADFLKKIRASLQIWTDDINAHEMEYESPLIEKPYRIISILTHLAKGHAIMEGRNYISLDDIPVVVKVTFSSMPENRRKLFKMILEDLECKTINSAKVGEYMNCSTKQALKTLSTLKTLEILEEHESHHRDQSGRPYREYGIDPTIKGILKRLKPFYELNGEFTGTEIFNAQVQPTITEDLMKISYFPISTSRFSPPLSFHVIDLHKKQNITTKELCKGVETIGQNLLVENGKQLIQLKELILKHPKDNYNEVIQVFGKERLSKWLKEGEVFESTPGTIHLL